VSSCIAVIEFALIARSVLCCRAPR